MKFMLKTLLTTTLLATLLGGCAGTDFKQPDPSALHLGESTTADIVRVMGEPKQKGELLKNSQPLKLMTYVYATVGGQSLYAGVVPARAMSFTTFHDVLVSQDFISSFKADATEFDDSKIPLIVKGKTTRTEVIELLGKPNGQAIYPMAKTLGYRTIAYSYSHGKGSAFKMKFYSKMLTVTLDSSDVVTDLEYVLNGEK